MLYRAATWLILLLLGGCSTLGSSNVEPTAVVRAQNEIAENQLLDVGIEVFDPGVVTDDQADTIENDGDACAECQTSET